MAGKVTSSRKQLEDTEIFQTTHVPGGTFAIFFLTFDGYQALGVSSAKTPNDPAFVAGLQSRQAMLKDAPVNKWDKHFQKEIHALVLIADDTAAKVDILRNEIINNKPASVKVLGEERGLAMRNRHGEGIEHSVMWTDAARPLLLQEDINEEADQTDGINVWSPAFPLKQALVPCKGGTPNVSFGSYFVFRKLEQDVKAFKKREGQIADGLNLPDADRELAGAMLVGRFEDGTPVVLQKADGANDPVMNNFNYESDTKGLKCPFHAHIRKTNPRGESVGVFAPDLESERSHIMARRGITYGTRIWENDMINTELDEDHLPSKDVGLLFMAYQNNIQNQFEFTQINWANNEGFVKKDAMNNPITGIDPVIGQGTPTIQLQQTDKWGKDQKHSFNFGGFVKMKGGEYFFSPCISFLKTI